MNAIEMPNLTSNFDFIQKMNVDVRYKWLLINSYINHNGKNPKNFEQAQIWYNDLLKGVSSCKDIIYYLNSRIPRIFIIGVGVKDPIYLTEPPHESQLELSV